MRMMMIKVETMPCPFFLLNSTMNKVKRNFKSVMIQSDTVYLSHSPYFFIKKLAKSNPTLRIKVCVTLLHFFKNWAKKYKANSWICIHTCIYILI